MSAPSIAVAHCLMVLRGGEREGVLAVGQREEADLLAEERLLDHQLGAGIAEFPVQHHGIDSGERLTE